MTDKYIEDGDFEGCNLKIGALSIFGDDEKLEAQND